MFLVQIWTKLNCLNHFRLFICQTHESKATCIAFNVCIGIFHALAGIQPMNLVQIYTKVKCLSEPSLFMHQSHTSLQSHLHCIQCRGVDYPPTFIKSKFVSRTFSFDSCVLDGAMYINAEWFKIQGDKSINDNQSPWQSVTQFVTTRPKLARTRGLELYSTFIEVASSKRQKALHSFFTNKSSR